MAKSADAFRTISEVADWLGVPTHVLRFWESKFPQVKPVKRAGGRRYYRPSDMLLLAGIRVLLHDDGVTIRGVQKVLREKGVKHVTALADREVVVEADAPIETTAEPQSADVVDLPRKEPEPQVLESAPDPEPEPEPVPSTEPLVLGESTAPEGPEDEQMPLFSSHREDGGEAAVEEAPGETTEAAEPQPILERPTSLRGLVEMLEQADEETAAAIRAKLADQKTQLEALRDRLAAWPDQTGSDTDG